LNNKERIGIRNKEMIIKMKKNQQYKISMKRNIQVKNLEIMKVRAKVWMGKAKLWMVVK
jgi:hypothetical protein